MDQHEKADRHLICTIIAPNYFSQALTLGESLAQHMPSTEFRILVIQDCDDTGFIEQGIDKYRKPDSRSLHKAETISHVNWQDFDIARAANYYDLLEFATSVKPALLRSYLEQGWSRVTYLDPDSQVHSNFEKLLDDDSVVSLTPHFLEDFPLDGSKPDQLSILTSGIFNLGFISVRPGARKLLDWWANKLQTYCTVDIDNGFFVDQRWMDWAVALTDPQIIRNPGMNVAYWNLHERQVRESGSGYEVTADGQTHPLYFFHFSGFVGTAPSHLSKFGDRFLTPGTITSRLLKKYATELAAWENLIKTPQWSIAGRAKGKALPWEYRNSMLVQARAANMKVPNFHQIDKAADLALEMPPPPLESGSCPSCGECTRPLLRVCVAEFASWLQVNRLTFATAVLADAGYSKKYFSYFSKAVETKSKGKAGLNLIGCFGSPTGMGQIARNVLNTLDAAGLPVYASNISTPLDSQDLLTAFQGRLQPRVDYLPCAMVFVNAENWFFEVVYSKRVNLRTQNIAAVWAWEIEHTPEYFRNAFQGTDAVFAVSPYSQISLSRDLEHNVGYLPTLGELAAKNFTQSVSKNFKEFLPSRGISSNYLLSRFDSKSVLKRKNPEAILNVWERIEKDYPSVQLVIKTTNLHDLASPDLLKRIKNLPRVVVIDESIPQQVNQELLQHALAYISLHRAEGLGLNILEAIAADIPAIFTNYSGLTSDLFPLGFPVDFTMVEVGPGGDPYPINALWAQPDEVDAVRQTRNALDLALSGEWAEDRDKRRALLENIYQSSHDLTVKIATDLLALPLKSHSLNQQSGVQYLRYRLKKEAILVARKAWKILPLNIRLKFRPCAMRTYRRLFWSFTRSRDSK